MTGADERDALPTPSEETASRLIAQGPSFDLPARLGPLGRWLRRLSYRFQRHLDLHYQKVFQSLLLASRERADRETWLLAGEFDGLRQELASIPEIRQEIADLREEADGIRKQLGSLESVHEENLRHETRLSVLGLQFRNRLDSVETLLGTTSESTQEDEPRAAAGEETAASGADASPEDDSLGLTFFDESAETMSEEEIRNAVDGHSPWYHQIELSPNLVSPGSHESEDALADLDRLGLPQDCSHLRALDIGCRDGFFAFELEKRGADVLGIDYESPEKTAFSLAARIKRSRVRFLVENVYNLDPEIHGRFDLILFLGVLYHLRNPVHALDRIRSVATKGALLFTETQMALDPAVRASEAPAWEFFPGDSLGNDSTNMWAPNEIGLRKILEECEFTAVMTSCGPARGYAVATADSDIGVDFFRRLDSARSS